MKVFKVYLVMLFLVGCTATAGESVSVPDGWQRVIGPEGRFVFLMPIDWVEDMAFGEQKMGEVYDPTTAAFLQFYGGLPSPRASDYEPVIIIHSTPIPKWSNADEVINEAISSDREGSQGTRDLGVVPFAGLQARRVTYIDKPDAIYTQGFETIATYLVQGGRAWAIYCGAGSDMVGEMKQCNESLATMKFK